MFPNNGTVWADSNFWAPEVYEIDGIFYMFASWTSGRRGQRLCSLKASSPLGPFEPICDDLGPGNDPTLYHQAGHYFLIHNDGSSNMQAHQMSEDFSQFVGDSVCLFDRTDSNVT